MKATKQLTLADLKIIASAAEAEALKNNWAVSIAISDAGGHLLWYQRLDGAPAMSSLVAPDKARTSALSGKPSKVFEDMVNNGRTAGLAMPISTLEGGEPILIDGLVIGAVGVSGVKAPEDAQIAQAGIKALLDTVV
ncbi:heme-binding protein [Paenalcaligenes niemegkensis]|uniref:GlcG/HbpS family heme-binding protein n=1 Tax=Paenalcaligenes niemegkensis TaxID=2895469 RepID=UPI001EE8B06D|nr:heme-binding protein [Paenalcaligenes niemegkensis]MCQ9617256.1 heme-binding protein [Paenalcaligenes niemegkensis]